jgi:hypothetical protein
VSLTREGKRLVEAILPGQRLLLGLLLTGRHVLYIDHCGAGGTKAHMFTMKLDGSGVKQIPNLVGHWVSWAPATK